MTDLARAKSFVNKLEIVRMAPDELAHYGVLGMKWGIRNDQGHIGERAKTKTIAKLDKKFEKSAFNQKKYFEVYNAMADRLNNVEINRINNMPKYKNKRPLDDPKLREAYFKEYSTTATRILNQLSVQKIGTNASGTRRVVFDYDTENEALPRAWVEDVEIEHVDKQSITVTAKSGYITHISIDEDTLAHFGVLGMRWGYRKPGTGAPSSNRAEKPSRKVRFQNSETGSTSKRKYSPSSSADHVESRELLTKKRNQLTNKDIQKIVDRLQKEQKLDQLTPVNVQRGKKITLGIIAGLGTAASVYSLAHSPAGQAAIQRGSKIVSSFLRGNGKHVLSEVVKTAKHLA